MSEKVNLRFKATDAMPMYRGFDPVGKAEIVMRDGNDRQVSKQCAEGCCKSWPKNFSVMSGNQLEKEEKRAREIAAAAKKKAEDDEITKAKELAKKEEAAKQDGQGPDKTPPAESGTSAQTQG